MFSEEIAKIIYLHLVTGALIAYQHITAKMLLLKTYNAILWYGRTRVTSYELQVENLKARVEIKSASLNQIHKLQVRIHKLRVWIHEVRIRIHELQVRISTSYEFESTSSRIIKNSSKQSQQFLIS